MSFISVESCEKEKENRRSIHTDQRQHHAAGDISDEYYDQRGDYCEGDAPLWVCRLFAGGCYYVEADERVKTRRCTGEHLQQTSIAFSTLRRTDFSLLRIC